MYLTEDDQKYSIVKLYEYLFDKMRSINAKRQLKMTSKNEKVLKTWHLMLQVKDEYKYSKITLVKYLATRKDYTVKIDDQQITLDAQKLQLLFGTQSYSDALNIAKDLEQIIFIKACQRCKEKFNEKDLFQTCQNGHLCCKDCLMDLMQARTAVKCSIHSCKKIIDTFQAQDFILKRFQTENRGLQEKKFFSRSEQQKKAKSLEMFPKMLSDYSKKSNSSISNQSVQQIFNNNTMKYCNFCQGGRKIHCRAQNIIDLKKCKHHKCQGNIEACYKCWGKFLRNKEEKKICLHCNRELNSKQSRQIEDIVIKREKQVKSNLVD